METALVDLANADARILGTRRDDALDDRRETLADRDVIVQKLFHRLIAAAFYPPAIERAVMPHHHRRRIVEPLDQQAGRSEEHTSELQSPMRISYAVFCLKKKTKQTTHTKQQATMRY